MADYDVIPITLRALDRADTAPEQLIDLAEQLRDLLDQVVQVRDLHQRSLRATDERLRSRVLARLVDLHETAGRALDSQERLARTLRSTGRL